MNKTGVITLIVMALVLAGIIVGSSFLLRVEPLPEDTLGNNAGNLYNGGYFDEDDGVVYFSNPLDHYAMYTMNPDETNIKKIIENNTGFINAAGKYIFYYQGSMNATNLGFLGHNTGVYRSNKNGKNIVTLARDPANAVKLVGNFVYYESFDNEKGMQIARVGIDKKNREILSDKVFDCSEYSNGLFYYAGVTDDHMCRTFDPNSKTVGTLFDGNISCPIISGGNIYYINNVDNYRLYMRSLSGDPSTERPLTDERVDCYNIVNDSLIYYQANDPDNPALIRMSMDGSFKQTVMAGNYTNINATSRFVYFQLWSNNGSTAIFHQDLTTGAVEQWAPPVYETK
ncbi:MAG: DUF5050 domain-containing protein [Lachnospiraceae bacterium]|nr:DUF5050 domain-containing protein [Lachnospiraceae bacterium]